MNTSAFLITLGAPIASLDGKHTIFGEVAEGLDVLEKINKAYVNKENRPLQNIRIKHTVVIDDPFDPVLFGLSKIKYPSRSPSPIRAKEDLDLKTIDFKDTVFLDDNVKLE